MKKILKEIWSYLVIILVVVLIRTFLVTPIRVNGKSMYPTLNDGYFMILKKYAKDDIDRFDIVVIKEGKEKLIKRVIGLPTENISIRDDHLFVEDEEIIDNYGSGHVKDFTDYCGKDEYYVLGDNREDSTDSRIFGCVKKENIIGKTDFIVFPFTKWGKPE